METRPKGELRISTISSSTADAPKLQDGCLQHLKCRLPLGTLQREQVEVASGHTDITYTPQPGMRFAI